MYTTNNLNLNNLNNEIQESIGKIEEKRDFESMLFQFKVDPFEIDTEKHNENDLVSEFDYKKRKGEVLEELRMGEKPKWWENKLKEFSSRSRGFTNFNNIQTPLFDKSYYFKRFQVLDCQIEKCIKKRCIPDGIHEVSIHERKIFQVSDEFEGINFLKLKCEKAKPSYSTLDNYYLIDQGRRAGVPSNQTKIIIKWSLDDRWNLPPFTTENWFFFKWVGNGFKWRGYVNDLIIEYKPKENYFILEFNYSCWVLNPYTRRWNRR
jgi:hypothetical protein